MVGCHSFAIAGKRAASDVAGVTTRPEHAGHPDRFGRRVRSAGAALQSWERSRRQRHQTLLLLCGRRSLGVSLPFLVGCHSSARLGNRAASDVRVAFTRKGGSMADPGSVAYLFNRKGLVIVNKTKDMTEDDVLLAVLDAGAEEVNDLGDTFEVISEPTDMVAVRTALQGAGITSQPLEFLLFSDFAVIVAYVHLFTLFMVVPIFNSMARIDKSLLEAARDAGAGRFRVVAEVVLPLSRTGIALGSIFVVTLVMGDSFVVRTMSGGQSASMVSALQNEVAALQYPPAAASAVIMVIIVTLMVAAILRVVDVRKELAG